MSIDELHVFWSVVADARARRHALCTAVNCLLAGFGWESRWSDSGQRCCFHRADATPGPPLSISYSGPVALALIGGGGGPVGIDVEAFPPRRAARYGRIVRALLGYAGGDPAATFVRAEAWSKASGIGMLRAPTYFLKESDWPGAREDGCFVQDIDLAVSLPEVADGAWSVRVAICAARPLLTSPQITCHRL